MYDSRTRRDELLVTIAARLRPLCSELPADDFEAMVHEIARLTLKYEGRATPTEFELEQMRRRAVVEREIHRTAIRTHWASTRP